MTRLRWYWTRSAMPLSVLSKRIMSRRYREEEGDGFVLDQVRDDSISGQYVERFTRIDETVNPFGNVETYERVDYRLVRFRISETQPGLEIWNAGRGYQKLISRLLEVTDFDLTLIAVSLDTRRWVQAFQHLSEWPGRVDKITVRGHRVLDEVLADIQVEGAGDIEAALTRITGRKDVVPGRLRFKFNGRPGGLVFSSDGAVEITASDQSQLIEAVRRSIAQISDQ